MASGGASILVGAVTEVSGNVVESSNLPLRPPATAGVTEWDVDGDGTIDFVLRKYNSNSASFDDSNGGRLVVPATASDGGISKLIDGFVVGDTLDASYKFFATAQTFNLMTANRNLGSPAQNGGWTLGDTGFFGFRFVKGSATHYGWGQLRVDGAAPQGSGFTVLEAYYEDEAGKLIEVGDLPDTVAPSLKVNGKKRIRTERGRVRIRGAATDDRGVATVRYQVGKKIRTARGTTNWRFALRVKAGRTKVRIFATDSSGNSSTPARVTVIRR